MVPTQIILLSGLIIGAGVFRDPNLDKRMKLTTGIVALVRECLMHYLEALVSLILIRSGLLLTGR